ncbi:hypothetical protein KBD49_11085 [Myxococcota bacterium]|nr:hypothetical protein [Myxococcota bacterium]
MDRRRFLQESGTWALGILVGSVADLVRASPEEWRIPGFPRKPLPGACLGAVTDVERTLEAALDAVVPGPSGDPEGAPGAIEACGMNILLDRSFPFLQYADLFALVLEGVAGEMFGRPFPDLTHGERVQVLVRAEETLPLLRLAWRAIRSAFFGGAYNGAGFDYVGYPGPNLGYRHVPECSFRVPVCRERTAEGWMP